MTGMRGKGSRMTCCKSKTMHCSMYTEEARKKRCKAPVGRNSGVADGRALDVISADKLGQLRKGQLRAPHYRIVSWLELLNDV